MRRIAAILAFLLIAGYAALRIFNWGMDVKDYVDTEQQKELVGISDAVVRPLNDASRSVNVMHDLLRRASDPNQEKHRGLVQLLGISGDTLPDSIAKARRSLQAIDPAQAEGVQPLLDEANALLRVYEGFVPVHAELAKRILASKNFPPGLAADVDRRLAELEATKKQSAQAFTKAQGEFLR